MNIQELHEELASNTIESARIGVVIPTLNASRIWGNLQRGLEQQGLHSSQILIIDSSSTDDTRSLAEQAGFVVIRIPRSEFSHGGTRELACRYLPWADFLVFMTQDAVLANDEALTQLCRALEDKTVGAAYGRQLPREEAGLIERHGRLFNYPPLSEVRSIENRRQLGFRAAFFSNSFAVYRRTALEQAGGFPSDAIVSEEVTVIARMLLAGWKIVYKADALAIHSHDLTLLQEFSRYFDIGVHHGRTAWLLDIFGTAGNQGRLYVQSEVRWLWTKNPLLIPYALLRTASKYVAYRLGTIESRLPARLSQALSNYPAFWLRQLDRPAHSAGLDIPHYRYKPKSTTK